MREAKLFSDWAAVDEAYEDAGRRFILALIAEAALPDLLAEIAAFVRRVAPAGAVNGLAQCLLRLTVPGVPDLYQGTEFWDFSLVDPDNRRPVDFAARASALGDGDIRALAGTWRDGRIKQALIARILALRRRTPELFAEGSYLPVRVEGERAGSVVAFARRHGEQWLLAAVPRLPLGLLQGDDGIGLAAEAWRGTALHLELGAGAARARCADGCTGRVAGRRCASGPALHDVAFRPADHAGVERLPSERHEPFTCSHRLSSAGTIDFPGVPREAMAM